MFTILVGPELKRVVHLVILRMNYSKDPIECGNIVSSWCS
jgi:hypothetical protein